VCDSFWGVEQIQNGSHCHGNQSAKSLVPLDVDVTGNITVKLCEVGSEFNIFCTLVTMATAAILNLNIVGIFTVVCGSFWRVDKIQNDVTMETEVPK
jgi:hypothetical protein